MVKFQFSRGLPCTLFSVVMTGSFWPGGGVYATVSTPPIIRLHSMILRLLISFGFKLFNTHTTKGGGKNDPRSTFSYITPEP